MRLAMSKLKYLTLWKDHITTDRQNDQNCLSTPLGIRPEHVWSRGLSLPAHHIICVISHFAASSQGGLSWSLCIHGAMHQGPEEEEDEKASELLCWVFPVSFVSLFWKRRRKNLSWMSCIETLAQKLLQWSYSAPSIPALNGLLSPDHWHDRNCGYHVTGSYCRLGGIRTFSHRLWTQYIFTESAELLDHSDPAT